MIQKHTERQRGPQARKAAKARKADRVQRERLASAAERAYLRLLEGQAR